LIYYSFIGQLKVLNKKLYFNGNPVFLSGATLPSYKPGTDFGRGTYIESKSSLEQWLAVIADNGGNTVRINLHHDGLLSPTLDPKSSKGIGGETQSLITELKEFLNTAEKHRIFVIITLWSGLVSSPLISKLFSDSSVLDYYLDSVLIPMAKALADQKSLIIWEIFNYPYSLIFSRTINSEPCFNTISKKYVNPKWKEFDLKIQDVLTFINRHASALHSAAPSKLVSINDIHFEQLMIFNVFSDECLIKAGGQQNGTLDIYQFGNYGTVDTEYIEDLFMKTTSADFNFNKPVIIGELVFESSRTNKRPENFLKALNNGYSGCLAYRYNDLNTRESINVEIKSISHQLVKIDLSED